MGILIGMDEAGYGPNFGPLVVAATAWECPDGGPAHHPDALTGARTSAKRPCVASASTSSNRANQTARRTSHAVLDDSPPDLYQLLRNIVAKSASERRLAIADSKVLYHPGLGLRQLERGVHSVLIALRQSLACWSQLVQFCDADPDGHHHNLCWHDGFDCLLPVNAASDELQRLAARFARACDAVGVRPITIRARLVFPAQFNELIQHYGSKGAALSHITVGLLRELLDQVQLECPESTSPIPQSPIHAVCDKHGGRNYYTALLQHHFADHWIEPVYETHAESRYEWGPPEARVHTTFRMQGEKFLPTALASMTAKYLRELAMRAFNQFWCARVADLRPTAGYPSDSHRFRKAIKAKQQELGIDDHILWRKR